MREEPDVKKLLEPFGLKLGSSEMRQLLVYSGLLLRWNRKINLTSVRDIEEIVTRHFGESLYLAQRWKLQGSLLDIGSGAGFPGLALKIVSPDLVATLLEPVAKKRAFLKEVARECEFKSVEVRPERLEEFTQAFEQLRFDAITARAVGDLGRLVPEALKILAPAGRLCLWVGRQQGVELQRSSQSIVWDRPMDIPLGRDRQIWIGRLRKS